MWLFILCGHLNAFPVSEEVPILGCLLQGRGYYGNHHGSSDTCPDLLQSEKPLPNPGRSSDPTWNLFYEGQFSESALTNGCHWWSELSTTLALIGSAWDKVCDHWRWPRGLHLIRSIAEFWFYACSLNGLSGCKTLCLQRALLIPVSVGRAQNFLPIFEAKNFARYSQWSDTLLDHEQDGIRSQACLDQHRVCLNLTLCSETISVKNMSLARRQTTKSNKLNPNKWISLYPRKLRCLF